MISCRIGSAAVIPLNQPAELPSTYSTCPPCRRSLILHGGALGDFIMSLRIVDALRAAGAMHVGILGRPEIAEAAYPGGGLNEIRSLETGGAHLLFAEPGSCPAGLADWLGGFDLAINVLGGAAVAANLKRAGVALALHLDPRLRPEWGGHISDQWLHDLRGHGFVADVGPPRIDIEPSAKEEAREQLRRTVVDHERAVVLCPGSGAREKCWPLVSYVGIAARLRAAGLDPVFLLGPVEQERFSRAEISVLRADWPCLDNLSVSRVARVLSVCRAAIGNDSGVMHLAASVGIKSVVVFGPTNPAIWRPLGGWVRVVGGCGVWPKEPAVIEAIEAAVMR